GIWNVRVVGAERLADVVGGDVVAEDAGSVVDQVVWIFARADRAPGVVANPAVVAVGAAIAMVGIDGALRAGAEEQSRSDHGREFHVSSLWMRKTSAVADASASRAAHQQAACRSFSA